MEKTFVVDLSRCQNAEHLAEAFGTDAVLLTALASTEIGPYYRVHSIPKRSSHRKGEARVVFQPATEELRQVHKTINRRLSDYACSRDKSFPPDCCYGFVRNRSTLENADQHKGHRFLLRVDIANFFPSIPQARVAEVLMSIALKPECAEILSRILCFNGALVPGLSASPMVANLVCRKLDARLLALAAETSSTYTRYADDMAFSGDAVPTLIQVAGELEKEDFQVAEHKHRLTKHGQAHFVTGLSIQDPTRPHVPKKMKDRLRTELYFSAKYSVQNHLLKCGRKLSDGVNELDGMVRYVSHIEKGTAFDFRQTWERLQARDDVSPRVGTDRGKERRRYFVAVDETVFETGGQRFLAVGFAFYEDEGTVDAAINQTLGAYMGSAFALGKKGDIEKHGLHYVECHPQLKDKFIERLPSVPMRVLVGVAELASESNEDKAEAYLRVFQWGVGNVCGRADHGELTLRVEDAPFIVKADIKKVIEEVCAAGTAANIRRPAVAPELVFVGKECAAVSLPDFMLGVLGTYVKECGGAEKKPGAAAAALVHFEQLRDRFTLIHDVDTRRYFSRRNPFTANSLDDRSKLIPSALKALHEA